MTIKIFYIIRNTRFGGGERVFLQLAAGLKSSGFEPVFLCPHGEPLESELRNNGIRFIPVDLDKQVSLKTIRHIADIMRAEKPDLIHSQGGRADFYARLAAWHSGLPCGVISTVAVPVELYDKVPPLKKAFYILLDRLTERFVDRFIAVSGSLRKRMIKHHHLRPQDVAIINNGIELNVFNPDLLTAEEAKKQLGIDPAIPVVGSLGRLTYEKGQRFLVQAAKDVLARKPGVTFLFVGDGELRHELENLARELGVADRCIFTGFREDTPDVLAAMDIFVLPSLHEGQPMALLEAMAMRKPSVVARIDGIDEIVEDGTTAVVVPPQDPAALACGIIGLLQDTAAARRIGSAARKLVEDKFTVNAAVAAYTRLYRELGEALA